MTLVVLHNKLFQQLSLTKVLCEHGEEGEILLKRFNLWPGKEFFEMLGKEVAGYF